MEKSNFIDKVVIYVKGGKGGDGSASFRHEKYVPKGGPDGGDGGNGGYVFLRANSNLSTLLPVSEKKKYIAENGENGKGKKMHGKNGKDVIIDVPVGTVVKDFETGEIIADLNKDGMIVCVARGGRGGRGNVHFKSPTMRAPKISERGSEGEEKKLILELKLLADVGLVGYPNVGKSSFISRISNAKPKIANYPFTTLIPNLGVVQVEKFQFVVADIPGLIKGASKGVGLGNVFLRHVERCSVIAHILDISGIEGRNPIEDYFDIRNELEYFSKNLAQKDEIIIANKIDLLDKEELEKRIKKLKEKLGKEIYPISVYTGEGIKEVLYKLAEIVKESKKLNVSKETNQKIERPKPVWIELPEKFVIEIQKEDNDFIVTGTYVEAWAKRLNLSQKDGFNKFMELLERNGLDKKLREAGAKDGDTVWIAKRAFEFKE
ncbi:MULTISPECIES: GTPase ObgE [unclassified Thermosipho (in: thermotogales)]|uniref:GTPase ObgE n=1 Tax=unclassified Thermosipho (in: thermotogales) TaxID=2676525 RepID=UPI0009841E64|nr:MULTISPECIES: GTPase ObgE [unclassified Thermosipho (in: thermotogales)]MBT1247149.1 GTPase Obg [Thermosipho sp. 1244]OOC47098.1 GTPase ObgE [Thermosipho sp. 1223]